MRRLWRSHGHIGGTAAHSWLAAGRMTLVAAGAALALSFLTLLPVGESRGPANVCACGLGNTPTMMADNDPALLYPVPPNTNIPEDQPIGIFAGKYVAGQPVSFVEDMSRMVGAPAPNTLQWRWTFGDKSAAVNAIAPSHTYAAAGKYNVLAQIYDTTTASWTDFDSAQIEVIPAALPNPPVVRVTADGTAVTLGGSITFDATGTHAVVGTHVTYLWNFNDASTATGPHVTHQFTIPGRGFVALLVTDDRGARSVATINIAVVNDQQQIPVASLTASPSTAQVGQRVTLDASGSTPASEPAGDQLTQYAWDFGDGTPAQTSQSPTITHVYQQTGQYRVAVQAIDQQGTPAQAVISVFVVAATAGALPTSVGSSGTGPSWLLIGGGLLVVLLVGGGAWYFMGVRRETTLRRQRESARQLRNARRIPRGGVRPGDPRWGDSRAGGRSSMPGSSASPARQPAEPRDARRGPPSGMR
ncbi:MAG TPA: PKD domain-containing protein [Ktedonobacterales bacterium]